MNEAQIRSEFLELHERCDKATQAINTLTSATSSHILRIRAYENIINDSWFLTRWLAQRKIEAEMVKINEAEAILRDKQMRQQARLLEQETARLETEAAEKQRNKKTDLRHKEALRLVKKSEKKNVKK